MGGSLLGFLALLPWILSLPPASSLELRRSDFPTDFIFGAGTAAFQVEGAAAEDGKGPSIWDTFTHLNIPGSLANGSNADVASDGYHHYKEDVKLMSETGLDGYRFSISWSRLIPNGRGATNPKGIEYYNNLIDELVNHGIQPHATLYHLDLPQTLEDEYDGWLSPKIVEDYAAYAELCFKEFGDRVFQWTTFNEPNIMAISGYDSGAFAPGRCSHPFGFLNCTSGNSSTEPYLVMHNVLLAHAAAVDLYRTKYQAIRKGLIGINVYAFGFNPRTDSAEDLKATERAIDFYMGWVLDPVTYGDYPKSMKMMVGTRLPSFKESQSRQLKGSIDFIGLNYYTTVYVCNDPISKKDPLDFFHDMSTLLSASLNDTPTALFIPTSFPLDPIGFERFLIALTDRYENLPIYIHENGFSTLANVTVDDMVRIDAIKAYMNGVLSSIRNGSCVKGYFVWSFLDVFELLSGYRSRFGLYYVDFEDPKRTRKPKLSALWYRDFLKDTKEVGTIFDV